MDRSTRIRGMILGTAVGDAVGLPAEGISRRRNQRMFNHQWRHRLYFNHGMISDDTEHTIFVSQCLIAHPNSPQLFINRLGWYLKCWLLCLPAGIGFATLKAIIRLWLQFKPTKSGVYSAGNGPAMRSAPIGAFFAHKNQQLSEYVLLSTKITHTDPRAYIGAKAVASLVAWIIREDLTQCPSIADLEKWLLSLATNDTEWEDLVNAIITAIQQNLSLSEFARSIGQEKGVTGYIYHTVPISIYAWYRYFGNFHQALSAVFDCGGDTDTTGAITGALMGATVGEEGIPATWLMGIWDYPYNLNLLRKIADRLAAGSENLSPQSPVYYCWLAIIPRNLIFLVVVLINGFRRLFPPYSINLCKTARDWLKTPW